VQELARYVTFVNGHPARPICALDIHRVADKLTHDLIAMSPFEPDLPVGMLENNRDALRDQDVFAWRDSGALRCDRNIRMDNHLAALS
jgi:hypothetical protein